MLMNKMNTIDRNWEKTIFADIMSPAKVVLCGNRKDLPVLSITMHDGIVEQKDRFKKVIASHDTSKYKVVKNGQLVIAFPIDEGLIYTQDVAYEGIMSPAYNVWDVNYENFDRRFLGLYFHSPFAMAYYKDNLRGTTQRRRALPKEVLLSMPIPKPSLSKQKEIVAEIDGISFAISLLQKQISDLDALTQAVFLDMFGDPLINPKHFDKIVLKDCSEFKNGINFSKNETGNEYKFLGVSDFGDKFIINESELSSIHLAESLDDEYFLKENDIVFVRSNGSKSMIGRCVMIQNTNSPTTYSGFCIRCRLVKDTIIPVYLLYLLKTNAIVNHITSSGRGCNINNLNQKILGEIPVIMPDLLLQESFAKKMTSIEETKANINSQIAEMKTLLAARMQYWFE